MWICEAPSSTARRASAAYSSGVYGIAGHWSRLAITPLIEQLITTGSSNELIAPNLPSGALYVGIDRKRRTGTSYRHHPVALLRLLDVLVARHLQRPGDRRAGLARVDHVVDHGVAGRDVGVDLLADRVQHRLFRRLGIVGGLDH